jgi:hypothetical protein
MNTVKFWLEPALLLLIFKTYFIWKTIENLIICNDDSDFMGKSVKLQVKLERIL